MLVLTRKMNERIRIGDTIELTIVDLAKGRVRIGFVAPPEVRIMRTELGESKEESPDDEPPQGPQGRDNRAGRRSSAPLPLTGGRSARAA